MQADRLQALPQSAAQLQCRGDGCPGAALSAEPRLSGSWLVGSWLGSCCTSGESGGGSASAQPLGLSGIRAASSGRASGSPHPSGLPGGTAAPGEAGWAAEPANPSCCRSLDPAWLAAAAGSRLSARARAGAAGDGRLTSSANQPSCSSACEAAPGVLGRLLGSSGPLRFCRLPGDAARPCSAASACGSAVPCSGKAHQDHSPSTVSCMAHVCSAAR